VADIEALRNAAAHSVQNRAAGNPAQPEIEQFLGG
jgi:hypothetical protein